MSEQTLNVIKYIFQTLGVVAPLLIAVVTYLDRKSEKRQKLLQDSVFLILQGLECIGDLSKCNAYELQSMDKVHPDTAKSLAEYERFHKTLTQFKDKVASGSL